MAIKARYPLGALAAIGLASTVLAVRHRQDLDFFRKLYQAKRIADQFYARCPTVYKNIRYHAGTRQKLDVYTPAGAQGLPVFVYFYGGSWRSGRKELYALVAQRLLPEGLVVVIPDYSTYPGGGYPRQTQEAAAALAWTLENVGRYGGDPRRVIVGAQSAGAQIAGLALLEPRWLAAHGHAASEVCGFIGVSGVFDVAAVVAHHQKSLHAARFVVRVMGGRQNLAPASPLTHAGPHQPPTLLIHGDTDNTVPLAISEAFHHQLLAAGVPSELRVYPGAGHASVLFDALTEDPSRLVTDILTFARACANRQPSAAPRPAAVGAAERSRALAGLPWAS